MLISDFLMPVTKALALFYIYHWPLNISSDKYILESNNLDSGKNKAFMFRYMFLSLMVTVISF